MSVLYRTTVGNRALQVSLHNSRVQHQAPTQPLRTRNASAAASKSVTPKHVPEMLRKRYVIQERLGQGAFATLIRCVGLVLALLPPCSRLRTHCDGGKIFHRFLMLQWMHYRCKDSYENDKEVAVKVIAKGRTEIGLQELDHSMKLFRRLPGNQIHRK
jgi:hypothetical protein